MHVSEGSFLALVDQDGDGLLSFGEYMFFLTLLAGMWARSSSIPRPPSPLATTLHHSPSLLPLDHSCWVRL